MFETFYYEYKRRILGVDYKNVLKAIKELSFFEKILLLSIALGPMLASILLLFKHKDAAIACMIGAFFSIIVYAIREQRPRQKEKLFNEVIKPYGISTSKKMYLLLLEYGIDIKDDKKIDEFLNYARKKQEEGDIKKLFIKISNKSFTYLFVPAMAIIMSTFFSVNDYKEIIARFIVVALVCYICIIIIISVYSIYNDMINRRGKIIKNMISDIEELRIYSDYVVGQLGEEEKKKDDARR